MVSFIIASVVSSLIFALAHNDFKFIPVYFGMGVIFSLAYVYTKRIAVPIGIHMLMNGSVVLTQVIGGDSIKNCKNKQHLYSILYFKNKSISSCINQLSYMARCLFYYPFLLKIYSPVTLENSNYCNT